MAVFYHGILSAAIKYLIFITKDQRGLRDEGAGSRKNEIPASCLHSIK